jgi:endonuclease/exonuclease/phosphatase family metal-dependent hydrolase
MIRLLALARARTAASLAVAATLSLLSGVIGAAPALARPKATPSQPVTAMSYNIFQGTELSHTLSATSMGLIPAAVAADYANVVASNFPARASALAAEIKANHPDLVGLQEAALWRTQTPPQGIKIPGNATTVAYDSVKLLVDALARRGLHYSAVAITSNFDVQATGAFPNGTKMDVRITDRVAILARRGVTISNVQTKNFTAHDSFQLLGIPIPVVDGWAAVDAKVGKKKLRFVTTHLDGLNSKSSDTVRTAEAREIATGPAKTTLPVVFTCDCNVVPNSAGRAALTAAGLRDAWSQLHPGQPGLTCCHRDRPGNPEVSLTDPNARQGLVSRLDYVLTTRPFRVLAERTVGLDPADRTKTTPRLWPSDHLGLVANLTLP